MEPVALRRLVLSGCGLGPAEAAAVAGLLVSLECLEDLQMAHNAIGAEGAEAPGWGRVGMGWGWGLVAPARVGCLFA